MAEGGFATSRGSEYEYNNENGFRRRSASPLLFVLRLAAPHPLLLLLLLLVSFLILLSSFSAYFGGPLYIYMYIYIHTREREIPPSRQLLRQQQQQQQNETCHCNLLNCLLVPELNPFALLPLQSPL